jgi:hypothetical protein
MSDNLSRPGKLLLLFAIANFHFSSLAYGDVFDLVHKYPSVYLLFLNIHSLYLVQVVVLDNTMST